MTYINLMIADGRRARGMELTSLGKYELRSIRGRGAMGTVYEAWDPVISRRVAIKTVRLPDHTDPEAQEGLGRFRREAQAAGRLNHPTIVAVYDYGETDDLAYIVMEYVDGQALKARLDRGDRLGLAQISAIMEQLLTGLQFSHDRGVVHRDIKPGNVLLTAAGTVKITDFGIARIESSSMTQHGAMLGTPAYMSPEQFMGHHTDARTDIYSTGALLFQLLTGARPFDGTMSAIMHKVLSGAAPRPSTHDKRFAAFDAVIAKAMARQPDDRFASADAFLAALRTAFTTASAAPPDPEATLPLGARSPMLNAGSPTDATIPHPATRSSLIPVILGGGLMAAALILGLGWYLLRPLPIPVEPPVAALTRPTPPPVPPAATPTSPPAPALPALPTPPPLTLAALRTAAAAAECTLANPQLIDDTTVFVTALARRGNAETALRTAITTLTGTTRVGWAITGFDHPPAFCMALDTLRPLRATDTRPSAALNLSLRNDATRLRQNDKIVLRVAMPDFDGHLQLDYLSSDGTITHLVSDDGLSVRVMTRTGWTTIGPSRRYPANTEITLGEPDPKTGAGEWQIDEPFGTDMLIAIVSSEPLFGAPRPTTDLTESYLRDLQTNLDIATRRQTRITAQAILLETVPR